MDVREKLSSEKRLIDANELKKKMCFKCNDEYSDEPCEPGDCVFCNAINDAQTIDAVSVVRCRECKHHKDTSVKEHAHCSLTGYTVEYDDFCSCGERKDCSE